MDLLLFLWNVRNQSLSPSTIAPWTHLRTKISMIILVALVAFGVAIWFSRGEPVPPPFQILFWVAILAGAELLPVSLGFGTEVTMAFPIHLALAITFRHQPWVAMAIAGLGAADQENSREKYAPTSAALKSSKHDACQLERCSSVGNQFQEIHLKEASGTCACHLVWCPSPSNQSRHSDSGCPLGARCPASTSSEQPIAKAGYGLLDFLCGSDLLWSRHSMAYERLEHGQLRQS